MSLESAEARRQKRIVEHIVGGFDSASEAIKFANTVEKILTETIGQIKFRLSIGAPDTALAITKDWTGATVLKTTVLEIPDQNTAIFVCDVMKKTVSVHEHVHQNLLLIHKEIVREKPPPQKVG